jgi:hypothetical protein
MFLTERFHAVPGQAIERREAFRRCRWVGFMAEVREDVLVIIALNPVCARHDGIDGRAE